MRKLFVPVVSAVAAYSVSAEQLIDFETTSGFEAGSKIESHAEWQTTVPDGAVVSPDRAVRGTRQSLRIDPRSDNPVGVVLDRSIDLGKQDVGYIDFWINPVADAAEIPESTVHANGSFLAFIADGANGRIAAIDAGNPTPTRLSSSSFRVDDTGASTDWVHVLLRQDYHTGKWDLFVDGALSEIDLGLDPDASKASHGTIELVGDATQPVYFDEIASTLANPLFKDSDNDGMPDAFETMNGMNPYLADRDVVTGPDGLSNIEKFQRASTGQSLPTGSSKVVYVDSDQGSDSCTGRLPYRAGLGGPKATVAAALRIADGETLIAISPGKSPYRWPSEIATRRNPPQNIHIQALGDIDFE